MVRIASFDIGKINFAFCIEEFDEKELATIHLPPLKSRYNPNGTPTPEMNEVLTRILKNGKLILFKNTDLTKGCDKGKTLDIQTYYNMYDLLAQYDEAFSSCKYIVIERQMMFGRQTNPMAVKLAQHCFSYFIMKHSNIKPEEYDAYNKTQVLGCEMLETKTKTNKLKYKTIDKPARKKWSVKKCEELFNLRNDQDSLNMFKSSKKKDDISDTILQVQAYKVQLCH